jgi:CHAT domain-containing protein
LAPTVSGFSSGSRGASIVHLAAHGSLRPDNPAFSFLQLTDGPLLVTDVSRLSLAGSTVVLSACSSGRSSAPAGDEWIGLARGFVQAGAVSVVASLWPIQDEPTLELVDRFYSELATQSVPVALGRAMRAQKERRAHPWHWAPFALLGGVQPSVVG